MAKKRSTKKSPLILGASHVLKKLPKGTVVNGSLIDYVPDYAAKDVELTSKFVVVNTKTATKPAIDPAIARAWAEKQAARTVAAAVDGALKEARAIRNEVSQAPYKHSSPLTRIADALAELNEDLKMFDNNAKVDLLLDLGTHSSDKRTRVPLDFIAKMPYVVSRGEVVKDRYGTFKVNARAA